MIKSVCFVALVSGALLACPALAQTEAPAPAPKEPLRVRVGLGAQVAPKFPGSDDSGIKPFWDFAITRGSKPFDFEAADESFGFPVFRVSGVEVGPAISLESSRRRRDVGAPMDEVGTTVEVGGFVQYWLTPAARIRTEVRKGLGGHRSWTGSVSADYVIRDGDKYVFALGPRVTLSDRDYQTAYFGVNSREAAAVGLPAYRPAGGVHAIGATTGMTYSLSNRWGLVGYAKYDRLVGDAGRSPFIRTYGKRDQFSAGLGLTYTFGRR